MAKWTAVLIAPHPGMAWVLTRQTSPQSPPDPLNIQPAPKRALNVFIFKSIKIHLYGQQSGSNGEADVSVLVKQEPVAGQRVFVVKLTTPAKSLDTETKTANATLHLTLLRLAREKKKDDASRRGLHLMLEEKIAFLEKAKLVEETVCLTAREAEILLNDAQERVRRAKEQFEKSSIALNDARSKREDAQSERLKLEEELQDLQLRNDERKKAIQALRAGCSQTRLFVGIDFVSANWYQRNPLKRS